MEILEAFHMVLIFFLEPQVQGETFLSPRW